MRPCRPRPRPRPSLGLQLESLEVEMRREFVRCSLVGDGGWRVALRHHGRWPMGITRILHRLESIPLPLLLLLPPSAAGLPGFRGSRGSVTTRERHGDFRGQPAPTQGFLISSERADARSHPIPRPHRPRPSPPDPTRSHPISGSSARVGRPNPRHRARESGAESDASACKMQFGTGDRVNEH